MPQYYIMHLYCLDIIIIYKQLNVDDRRSSFFRAFSLALGYMMLAAAHTRKLISR